MVRYMAWKEIFGVDKPSFGEGEISRLEKNEKKLVGIVFLSYINRLCFRGKNTCFYTQLTRYCQHNTPKKE